MRKINWEGLPAAGQRHAARYRALRDGGQLGADHGFMWIAAAPPKPTGLVMTGAHYSAPSRQQGVLGFLAGGVGLLADHRRAHGGFNRHTVRWSDSTAKQSTPKPCSTYAVGIWLHN